MTLTVETGDQAGNRKKPPKIKVQNKPDMKPEMKLDKGSSKKPLQKLKKMEVQVDKLIHQLFKLDKKDGMVRSYTLFDFSKAV